MTQEELKAMVDAEAQHLGIGSSAFILRPESPSYAARFQTYNSQ